jgi:hypothetical protein
MTCFEDESKALVANAPPSLSRSLRGMLVSHPVSEHEQRGLVESEGESDVLLMDSLPRIFPRLWVGSAALASLSFNAQH